MFVGIDLGTSSVKAMLVDDQQKIIGSCSAELSVSRPHSGWSEQNPAEWINAVEQVVAGLKQNYSSALSKVQGIGLAGHMHGATLIDASDKVIRPCMLWNDTRSHLQASKFDANPIFRKLSGNIVFPGFTAPKVDWVRENEPENFGKISKILLPKDYLRFWLTGEYVSEMSDASGTSWLDVEKRDWSSELLSVCELERSFMPMLVEGCDVSGVLRTELASKWGMPSNVVVAGGAGDNAASAIGMGTVAAGSAFISLGTSGVLFAANDSYLPNPESAVHTFCHALPKTWHQMGVILSATDSLNWLSKITSDDANTLTSLLGKELRTPTKTLFLPYLGGERTPHNDADVRGSFVGLEHESGKLELTQAVLEGVVFAFKDNLKALNEAGTNIDRATAVGGGANSEYWLKLLASILDIQIDVPTKGDFGAALGACRLAMLAAGAENAFDICAAPTIERTILPEKNHKQQFLDAYKNYRAQYVRNSA